MKTLLRISKIASLLAVLGTLPCIFVGCASTATSESAGEYVDDTVITAKIKSALLGDAVVKSFAVSVETVKGVVQLSGFVNTEEQKAAAGKDAASVKGVKNVVNNLIVK